MRAPASLFLAAVLLLSLASMIQGAHAQPTWSFRVRLPPSELYIGEWGIVEANLTNMDCSSRVSEEFELQDIPEQELDAVGDRAGEMLEAGLIQDYDVAITYSHGVGGRVYHDARLKIVGACSGRSILVHDVLLWFPWRGYPWREMGARVKVEEELRAFNPIEYMLKGVSPGSSKILAFKVFIPPDIGSEERLTRPRIDIRVHYPDWMDYTLEGYLSEGFFEIKPYRSFNLTITDYDGLNPIAGARVVMRRLIYYHQVREYVTPENGTIRIHRLYEGDYEVMVYWSRSSYRQESEMVYVEQHSAYELASEGVLKTLIFSVEARVMDLRNRPLDGAEVLLDGVRRPAENGVARFQFVPNGNHTIQAYWMDAKLLEEWIWVGYHPTLFPVIRRPRYDLVLPVDDLVVQAVDSGGLQVGANFTVIDQSGRLPNVTRYSRDGSLNVSRVPLGEYLVEAVNCSRAFRACVRVSGKYSPGHVSEIRLPVHSVSLKVYSMSGVKLPNATVSLGPVSAETDGDGSVRFSGVPKGEYTLAVSWRGVEIYRGNLTVSSPLASEIRGKVYDIALELRTGDGDPFMANWILVDPLGGIHSARLKEVINLKLIPRGFCKLKVFDEDNVTILSEVFDVEELARLEALSLPIKDLVIKVAWEDGAPMDGVQVLLRGVKSYEAVTDSRGEARLRQVLFSRYSLMIRYPGSPLNIARENVTFSGSPIDVRVREAQLRVKVVDWLGKPLRGAIVRLSVLGVVLGQRSSGADGYAEFLKLPYFPEYGLEVEYGSVKADEAAYPGHVLTVRLKVISLLGLEVTLYQIMYAAIAAVLCAAAIVALKTIPRKRLHYSLEAY